MSFQSLKGQTLGQFELRELIGAGGMGAVYLGFQPNLNRSVAVKVLLTHLVNEEGYIERFNREAQIAAALEHPHIIPIIDFGTQRGINYVVMRLLRGGTLAERVKQRQATAQQLLSLGEIADLLRQVGSALDYAHAQGVIHRDIKPSNIMFDDQGTAFLVDFGIAKPMNTALEGLTAPGTSMGTIAYMSPEQWRGEELTAAIDQYAMGLVVYTLLTGRPAFEAPPNAPYAMMNKHVNEMPIPVHEIRPDIPQEVSAVIERGIAKKATDRFPTVSEMSKAFARAIRGSSGVPTGFFTFALPKKPQLIAAMPAPTATPTPLLNKPLLEPEDKAALVTPPRRADDRTLLDSDVTNPALGEVPLSVRDAVRQQSATNNSPVHMGTYDEPKRSRRSFLIGGILAGIVLVAGLIFLLFSQQNQNSPNTAQAVSTFIAETKTAEVQQTADAVVMGVTQTLDSITKTAAGIPTLDPTDAALMATGTKLAELAADNATRAGSVPTSVTSAPATEAGATSTTADSTTVGSSSTPQEGAVVLLPTYTYTASETPSTTPSLTASVTSTSTPTSTITPSQTASPTFDSVQKTALALSTNIKGETQTATFWTQTPTPSDTPIPTATLTPSNTLPATATLTPTFTPSLTETPIPTATYTASVTFTPSPQPVGIGQFEFDGTVPGTGWKAPETDANGQTLVWTEGASATLNLTLPSQDSVLTFSIAKTTPESLLPTLIDKLHLSVGDLTVPFYQRVTNNVVENIALIRADVIASLSGQVPLLFTLDDAGQTEPVAFAMNWLRIEGGTPETLPLRVDFDVPVAGSHWYEPENPANTTYQWMEGATSSILLNLPTNADLRIQFRALAEDQEQLTGMTMIVNGDTIALQAGRREGTKVINSTATVPATTLQKSAGFTMITFQVPKAITIPPDQRTFGARFDFIVIDLKP